MVVSSMAFGKVLYYGCSINDQCSGGEQKKPTTFQPKLSCHCLSSAFCASKWHSKRNLLTCKAGIVYPGSDIDLVTEGKQGLLTQEGECQGKSDY